MERTQQDRSRSIHLLRDQVARKIAAGEVIDRPFSLLRELMDNAVDAGADTIDVHLAGGGTRSVRVVDNGCGMEREDLELCFLPHATSKISEVEDLDRITSLGFRGEALSSIAACSRLRITSAVAEGEAFTIEVDNGKLLSLQPSKGRKGTVVEASDLFYSIPARKRFLKSDQAELSACRKLFAEKALAFPEISFRLFSEGELKLFLPASSLIDRVTASYPGQVHASMIHTIQGAGEGFHFTALGSGLSLYRKDRRYIHIYVNKRKIDEFSLVQAVSYGYGEYLPGGTFPVCFLFLEVDPERVDFNIHPAKKEVRFRGLKEIHHQVSSGIRDFLRSKWPTPLPYEIPAADDRPHLSEGEKNDFGSSGFPKPSYDKAPFSKSSMSPRSKNSFLSAVIDCCSGKKQRRTKSPVLRSLRTDPKPAGTASRRGIAGLRLSLPRTGLRPVPCRGKGGNLLPHRPACGTRADSLRTICSRCITQTATSHTQTAATRR